MWRGREHLVKCLPFKQENLNLIPRTHVKKLGVMVCMCNPRVESWGQVDSWVFWLAGLR